MAYNGFFWIKKSQNILKIVLSVENDKRKIVCKFQVPTLFVFNHNKIRKSFHEKFSENLIRCKY